MSLNARVTEDMKTAMKRGDQLALDTLRMLRAQLIELSKRGEDKPLTPDDEMSALRTAIKKRKEAIELYEKGGRKDLAERETKELELLSTYLPRQLTPQEAEERARQVIQETGSTSPKDVGKVMGALMKELKGQIDGKILQELVRRLLGG